jgi:ATP-dependent RNA helicase DDX24/MAK5
LKQDGKLASMKAELKGLLSQPLLARGASMKYITSGSNPLVEELLQREQELLVDEETSATPVLLGIGGSTRDPGKDVVDATKKNKKVKATRGKDRGMKLGDSQMFKDSLYY